MKTLPASTGPASRDGARGRRAGATRLAGRAARWLAAALVLPACTALPPSPGSAWTGAPSAADFAGWSCDRLAEETGRVQRQAVRVAYPFASDTAEGIVQLGDALVLHWPAVMAMRLEGIEAPDLVRLKTRFDALQQAGRAAACGEPAMPGPPGAPAAHRWAAGGQRLVYEDRRGGRGIGGGAMQRWGLRLHGAAAAPAPPRAGLPVASASATGAASSAAPTSPAAPPLALRRESDAPAALWVLDAAGRLAGVAEADAGWSQALDAPLALGQLTAGEFVLPGDSAVRARLRGQVMAFGVQRAAAERFDAALIELFGDAPSGDAYTRVEGAMVVDRGSGLVLRLDLRSAHPSFNLHRRLVAVESVGASR